MNRIEKRGKVTIIDSRVVLKDEPALNDLENYLLSRDFSYFIPVSEREDGKNKYEYVADFSLSDDQKAEDMIKTLALLHNKTSYIKEVSEDKFKEIYDNISGYINYVDDYYREKLRTIEYIAFPSPSEMLFMSNYTKISDALNFDRAELENWYKLVKNKHKERVCLNHGDMRLSHVIVNDKPYFINWKNKSFDSPVIDLVKLYENEWEHLEFETLFEDYFSRCELTDEEKKLLFITISIPKIINSSPDELTATVLMRKTIDYLYKTERLIGPYYTKKQEE